MRRGGRAILKIMEVRVVALKLLIVDDEVDIVDMLKRFFERKGYEVITAYGGQAALKQVQKKPDMILLDINMPDMDGLQVCTTIRKHVSCPILFLTARIEDADKVQGFASGGDDYVVKPFSLDELAARVAAHLRREQRHASFNEVRFDKDLVIDYSQRAVLFRGEPISFAKKEFDIIEFLSQNSGQVFDRERIYERVWGLESDGDSSVVVEHIRRIRVKLTACEAQSYIETVWGCGYKWKR